MADSDQLWSVPKLENVLLRRNASTNGKKTDLIERYIYISKTQAYDLCLLLFNISVFVECPSNGPCHYPRKYTQTLSIFTYMYYQCINTNVDSDMALWSKLPRLKIKHHKIMITDQFECALVTGFRDKTRRICHI